jgi:hypothetical protein
MKKNRQISSIASAIAVLGLLVWVGISVVVWRSPVEGAPQKPKRMLLREHPGVGEPVAITNVTVAGKEVEFKKGFDAGDEWFESLAVTVENRSQKPMTHIAIRLLFPRQDGSTEPVFADSIWYGESFIPTARKGSPSIAPGESVEIKRSENIPWGNMLSEIGYSQVNSVELSVNVVMWADGTKWEGGRIWSKASGKWAPTKPSPQPV